MSLGCWFLQQQTLFSVKSDSHIGFCSERPWKHELNLRSSYWSCSVKEAVLKYFANFTGKHLRWSFFLIEFRSSHQNCSIKRAVLISFAIFTGKQLCWRLFLIKLQGFETAALLKRNTYFEEHLRTAASEICSFTWTALSCFDWYLPRP